MDRASIKEIELKVNELRALTGRNYLMSGPNPGFSVLLNGNRISKYGHTITELRNWLDAYMAGVKDERS